MTKIYHDLFGNPVAPFFPQAPEQKRAAGLKTRILEYFSDHKYESFTLPEIIGVFKASRIESVTKLFNSLKKSRHIIGTGDSRGTGVDNQCHTLNLHRR